MKNSSMYGYARVSSRDQNEVRQLIALCDFGVAERNVYLDKQSGRNFERPAYQMLISKLKPKDTLVVKSIDRLGRNYEEILEQWRLITKKLDAYIVILDMPILDTRQGRDLTGVFIADIVLQLLSYVAQTERENIKQRQSEGIAAAKARGVRFGKQPLPVPDGFTEIYNKWVGGEINSRQAGAILMVSQNTFLKWARAKKGNCSHE